jgi:hypothetical protein
VLVVSATARDKPAWRRRECRPYLSQIETGKRDGTAQTMKKLALALDVTVDDLI